MKRIISAILTAAALTSLTSCSFGSSSKLSPEEKFKRQAQKNAQAYVSEKYGFTAKVIKCSMITEDTYKCPMNYNPGEDAKVTLKHNNEDFYVVISGTEETSEGSNLSDMIYPYNFCCVEVFGRDLYGKLRQNIKLPPLFRRRHK